jgi:hypothetical protein
MHRMQKPVSRGRFNIDFFWHIFHLNFSCGILFSGDVTRAIIPFSLIASRPFTINNMYQPKEGHFRQAAEGQDKMEMPRRNKFYKNKNLVILAFSLILVLIVPKIHFSVADEILPNFVLIYDQPWLYQNTNILNIEHRQNLLNDLSIANCKYVVVFIGYWNATDPANPLISPTPGAPSGPQNYVRTPTFYQELITQLRQIGIQVFCWIEDGVGLMDISPANRPNIFSAILEAVNTGFDGFTDDIENWVGRSDGSTATLRQANSDAQIDYLNNLTTRFA